MKKNFVIIKTLNKFINKELIRKYHYKKHISIDNLLIFYDEIYKVQKFGDNNIHISIHLDKDSIFNKIFEFDYHDNNLEIKTKLFKTKVFFSKNDKYLVISNDLYSLKDYGNYKFSHQNYFRNILLNFSSMDLEQTIFNNVFSFTSNTIYLINNENIIERRRLNIEIKTNNNLKTIDDAVSFFSIENEKLVERYSNLKNIGLLLSSGNDSSMLAYYLSKKNLKITNFTLAFNEEYSEWDESKIAREYSNYLNQKHERILFKYTDYEDGLKNSILFAGCIPINESEITFFKLSKLIKSFDIENILNADGWDWILGHNFGQNKKIIHNIQKKFNFNIFNKFYEFILYRYPFQKGLFRLIKYQKNIFKFSLEENFILKKIEVRYLKYLLKSFNREYLKIYDIIEIINSVSCDDDLQKLNIIDIFLGYNSMNKFDNFFHNQKIININSFDYDFFSKMAIIPSKFNNKDFLDDNFYTNEKFLLRLVTKKHLPNYISNRRKYGFGIPSTAMLKKTNLYDYLFSKRFLNKDIIDRNNINLLIKSDSEDHISGLLFRMISYEILEEVFT